MSTSLVLLKAPIPREQISHDNATTIPVASSMVGLVQHGNAIALELLDDKGNVIATVLMCRVCASNVGVAMHELLAAPVPAADSSASGRLH